MVVSLGRSTLLGLYARSPPPKPNSESSALFLLPLGVPISLLQGVSPQQRPGEPYCPRLTKEMEICICSPVLWDSWIFSIFLSLPGGGHWLSVCQAAGKLTGPIKNTCSNTDSQAGLRSVMCSASRAFPIWVLGSWVMGKENTHLDFHPLKRGRLPPQPGEPPHVLQEASRSFMPFHLPAPCAPVFYCHYQSIF